MNRIVPIGQLEVASDVEEKAGYKPTQPRHPKGHFVKVDDTSTVQPEHVMPSGAGYGGHPGAEKPAAAVTTNPSRKVALGS